MSDAALLRMAHDKFIADFDGRHPLQMGVVDGICWATTKAPLVGVNGYAMIPAEGHPWSTGFPGDDEWDLDDILDVHGGVTYAKHPWVGFDTAHAWDWWPPEFDQLGMSSRFLIQDGSKRWTPALVAYEARKLAIQVAKIGFEAKRAAEASNPGASRFRHLDVSND